MIQQKTTNFTGPRFTGGVGGLWGEGDLGKVGSLGRCIWSRGIK